MSSSNPDMTEAELGYLAALIDGEGCLTLDRNGQPSLQIINTDERIIGWLRVHIPVDRESVSVQVQRPLWHKPRWSWRCPSKYVALLLTSLLPYLVCKREQAEILIAVDATIQRGPRPREGGRGGSPLTPSVVEFRTAMIARIHVLNRRGAPVLGFGT
jgi:hypothetical protein